MCSLSYAALPKVNTRYQKTRLVNTTINHIKPSLYRKLLNSRRQFFRILIFAWKLRFYNRPQILSVVYPKVTGSPHWFSGTRLPSTRRGWPDRHWSAVPGARRCWSQHGGSQQLAQPGVNTTVLFPETATRFPYADRLSASFPFCRAEH